MLAQLRQCRRISHGSWFCCPPFHYKIKEIFTEILLDIGWLFGTMNKDIRKACLKEQQLYNKCANAYGWEQK
ncbi:hypothetical protein BLA28_00025 [Eisenbergiella tayi]|nr:hypothetical protein BLA28_00025 [Eisenbergiella tayi]RJW38944.1 hypothetical protein DXC97_12285 [Lachnospiraceae bacterium TF09-5]RJW41570.1 hypothetical protein DXB25_28195 [Lachnospiraceae bacterium OM02-31]RJW51395.1 hypothetical protein DXB24_29850 [Lachnospiraceae bacterium OM02-3]